MVALLLLAASMANHSDITTKLERGAAQQKHSDIRISMLRSLLHIHTCSFLKKLKPAWNVAAVQGAGCDDFS